MPNEAKFDITPDQISNIGLHLRNEDPDYIWGVGDFRNAIFEFLVTQHKLPWDESIGCPDWDDPLVKELYRSFTECLQLENETEYIDDAKAHCITEDCNWESIGQAKVERADRILTECDLTNKCRQHHLESGEMTKHNRFTLYVNNNQVGMASVSSQVCTGYIEP